MKTLAGSNQQKKQKSVTTLIMDHNLQAQTAPGDPGQFK